LDETKKAAAELKRAIEKGLLSKTVGSVGHLRNELVKTRRRAQRIKVRLEDWMFWSFTGNMSKKQLR